MIDPKEWTLMFYFASDQSLAPDILSQVKSLKQAGFHDEANVIVHFDPHPVNVETHVFDINRINKVKAKGESKVGFVGFTPNDPFVVNLMTDKLWRDDPREGPVRQKIIDSLKLRNPAPGTVGLDKPKEPFNPPLPPPSRRNTASVRADSQEDSSFQSDDSNELSPRESLENFLTFCSANYPARNYILFILGHGLIVGNDTFLADDNAPEHFLGLRQLRKVLENFKESIKTREGVETGAEFQLVSFHSCSMSSMEVACEIQGIANYMLASQSPSFVGSWPYRQILIRIFNYLDRVRTEPRNVKKLFTNFFSYCLYNSYDFLVAGYSCDLCLCDLSTEKVSGIEGEVSNLSEKLIEGLDSADPRLAKECILLAHLDAQSYFDENYVDLFDFCFCLQGRIKATGLNPLPTELDLISRACQKVMELMKRGVEGDDDGLIIRSDFVGPSYQYSHGLSLFFPWFKPVKFEFWPEEYGEYKFIKARTDARETSWSDFLKGYFEITRRDTRIKQFADTKAPGFENEERPTGSLALQAELLEACMTAVFNSDGQLSKPDPDNAQGTGCTCQSIKNYPPFTREPQTKGTEDDDNGFADYQERQIPIGLTLLDDSSFIQEDERSTFVLDGLILP